MSTGVALELVGARILQQTALNYGLAYSLFCLWSQAAAAVIMRDATSSCRASDWLHLGVLGYKNFDTSTDWVLYSNPRHQVYNAIAIV